MGFLQLLKKQYKLPVETTQILQGQLVMNNSEIVLFYEDHVQLWNLDIQKLISKSPINEEIYFWSVPVPIDSKTFAFVSLFECKPYLGTFSFDTNKVEKVAELSNDQENFSKLFYFEHNGFIGIDARGKEHRLLIWNGKSLE
jgi:hypothetical protein